MKRILLDKLGARGIYVGENFYFGRGARADAKALRVLSGDFNFKVNIMRPIRKGNRVVSSSLIRRLIMDGRIDEASKLLGRPVSILGTVVRGRRRGRILGYPTANINPHHEAIPPSGVYAVKVNYGGEIFKGVLNIGIRPTFLKRDEEAEPTIEVHILDFDEKIYGEDLEILFVKKIRDEIKFKHREALRRQIRQDDREARLFLR